MGRAHRPAMHPLSFLLKRGHLSAVALGRKMFARVPEMTPARFDILHLIFERSRLRQLPGLRLSQKELREKLGLRRQTVWQAVVRLVELGLVEKLYDHRGRVSLRLTEEGYRRIRIAYAAAFTERYPLPPDVPVGEPESRFAYRLVRDDARWSDHFAAVNASFPSPHDPSWARMCISHAPAKVGREVAKTFTAFAVRHTSGGRRGRRRRYLEKMDDMILEAQELARALGNESELIYRLDERADH